MAAHGWLRRIEQLDPKKDHQEIYRISSGYEFPWDYTRALELALFRTYCVPSISALLDATGEFRQRPQRRYDDTALLMSEMVEHGYDSERGREALRVINRVHHRYVIDHDDLRYVLSTFIFEPIDWIDRFGWRRLTEAERLAGFHFYREVGLRMGIKDLPAGPVEFRQFKQDYERDTFRWTETNQRVGTYTLELLSSWYPAPVRPVVRKAVRGLLDEPMLTAFGFAPTSRSFSRAEHLGLRARALVAGLLPARRTSALSNQAGNRSYPGYPTGYRPADLGAPPPPADLDPKWLRGGLRPPDEE
jgi:hypothetical protein